ncbi:MAG: hypothetical protein LBD46_06610 [Endomicrobium sp.]|jgi:transposase-like protein|nr:hypothetical protein [Endomicrobium sp.]
MKTKSDGLQFETNNWAEILAKEYSKYEWEVGIIEDILESEPKYGEFKQFHGGKALQKGRQSEESVSEIAKKLDVIFNWLLSPWRNNGRNANNFDVLKCLYQYAHYLVKPEKQNALRNAVQAVVCKPILRGDYGDNSEATAEKKGFNRLMIATGTFFKSIKAIIKRKGK